MLKPGWKWPFSDDTKRPIAGVAALIMPNPITNFSPVQEAIRARCFHPSRTFVEFRKEGIEQSIAQYFEQVVRQHPNRIAIKSKDQALTYDELDVTANAVACAVLNKHGEGNKPVAIIMEHGPGVLVTILGLLKAGKIYVPLDPSYPLARLRYMLRDSQADLILTDSKNAPVAHLIAAKECSVIRLDQAISSVPRSAVGVRVAADALAYIPYTSGSTGQPKGVIENHRNVLHGTLRFTNGLHLCVEDRLPLTHSCSSSASVRRIFPALLNGATLYPYNMKQDGMPGLLELLVKERITVFSTGRIRDFVRTVERNQGFDSLRLISFGGEVVYKSDVEIYRKTFPAQCIIGIWMSTTETGNVTQFLIDSETDISSEVVPIGYPAEDVEIVLRDEDGSPIAHGETGEIAVKSRYLSPGYWQRPDLTMEKFLVDSEDSEKRLYLTGGWGRFDRDGCLFHLGRKDDQVKIRGYRVEVAETEVALQKLSSVKKAFVAVREKNSSEKILIAYVVPETQPPPASAHLRHALAKTLPDFMIPSAFVMMDQLPLTPTGKIDRKALPDSENGRPELDNPFVAPRTAIETQLTQVWADVLRLDRVGVNDNFFDLGGHSLAAMRVISQVFKKFQREIPLQSLFQSPTIAEIAALIDGYQGKRLTEDELQSILTELDSTSEEKAERILADAKGAIVTGGGHE